MQFQVLAVTCHSLHIKISSARPLPRCCTEYYETVGLYLMRHTFQGSLFAVSTPLDAMLSI
jgi:hypothetical protein